MVDVKGVPGGSRGALREVAQRIERWSEMTGGRGFESHPSGQERRLLMCRDSGETPRKIKPAIESSETATVANYPSRLFGG